MNATSNVLAVIPARGGSKGLPGKNIKPLLGIPLIAHSILLAKMCSDIDKVVVSTDSDEIADVAQNFGADVPFIRPRELAEDCTPTWPVIRHALNVIESMDVQKYDFVMLLEPTSPGRSIDDVDGAFAKLQSSPDAEGIIGVSQPHFNPYWLSVVERDGWMENLIDGGRYERRQDVPVNYFINGIVYIWRSDFVRNEVDSWRKGKSLIYETPEFRSISIDNEHEFEVAELLARNGLINFPWLDSSDE